MRMIKTVFILSLLITGAQANAQDSSLLKMLDDSIAAVKKSVPVTGTFKGTKIIDLQSVEAPAKHVLNFMIQHRFGTINQGAYNLFGLDNATMRFGFDYGLTNTLSIGVGRSTFEKMFDGYLKYKLIRQTEDNAVPVTADIVGGLYYNSLKYDSKPYLNSKYRTAYSAELLIARKFSRNLSLQLTPVWIHNNLVATTADKNNLFALGMAGRLKITRRFSLTAEYNYLPSGQVNSSKVYNSFSAGVDIETGGHVFQLHVTNSQGMVDPVFIAQTTGSWGDGNIYFGFNVSRAFNVGKKPKQF